MGKEELNPTKCECCLCDKKHKIKYKIKKKKIYSPLKTFFFFFLIYHRRRGCCFCFSCVDGHADYGWMTVCLCAVRDY